MAKGLFTYSIILAFFKGIFNICNLEIKIKITIELEFFISRKGN
jgi:hypothetical protein